MSAEVTQKPKRPKRPEQKPQHMRKVSRKDRDCLLCTNTFRSEGPGNRICIKCKAGEAWRGSQDLTITRPPTR